MARIRSSFTSAHALALVALFVALGGSAIAARATLVASDGSVRGCVGKKGAVRIVAAGKKCARGEKTVTWAQQGPAGTAGGAGAAGAAGTPGAKGETGERGPDGAPGQRGPQGDKGDDGLQGPANPTATDANQLDGLDSTDFLQTSTPPGGDLTGVFGNLQIGVGAVGTTEVDSSLTAADIADTKSLGTAEINESDLVLGNADRTDGQSIEKINFFGPAGQGTGGGANLGDLSLSFNCDESNGDVSVLLSTAMDNAQLAISDHDSNFIDGDFDTAENPVNLESVGVAEGNVAQITYRSGTNVATVELTFANTGPTASNQGPCYVFGDAIWTGG